MKKESSPSSEKDNVRENRESRGASGLGRRRFIRNTLVASTAASLGQVGVVPAAGLPIQGGGGQGQGRGPDVPAVRAGATENWNEPWSGARATGRASNCTSTSWKTKTPDARLASAIPALSCSVTVATHGDLRSG